MSELRLVGLDDDEAAVVLQGPDGQRFTLPIDDALRAAVRRDRPLLEQVRARATSAVPPREMQARMRAGASAQEVAEDAGVPVEVVERYEGPVPRRHLAAVRTTELDVSAALRPVLAAVDLPPAAPEPAEDPVSATEALLEDLRDRRGTRQALEPDADDDLEEFEGFGPQHAFDFDHPGLTAPPGAHPAESRPEEAVDATVLPMAGRGRPVPEDDDASDEPATAPSAPDETTTPRELVPGRATTQAAEPAFHDAVPAVPAVPAEADEHPAAGAAAGGRSRGRKGRASVPSWDEIVFGAKPE